MCIRDRLETILGLSFGEMPKPHGENLEDEMLCFTRVNKAKIQANTTKVREEDYMKLGAPISLTQADATWSRDNPPAEPFLNI